MQLYGESGSWQEFIQFEREARLELKRAKQEAEKKRAKRLDLFKNIGIVLLTMLFFGLLILVGLVVYLNMPT